MNNHFRVYGIKRDGSGLTKKFANFTHIGEAFIRHMGAYNFTITPAVVCEFIERERTVGKFSVFLVNNDDKSEKLLSWEDIYEKVKANLASLEADAKITLDNKLMETTIQLATIENDYKNCDKTTLQFILIDEPRMKDRFRSVFENLKQLKDDFNKKFYHKYIDGFHMGYNSCMVSADDFVL